MPEKQTANSVNTKISSSSLSGNRSSWNYQNNKSIKRTNSNSQSKKECGVFYFINLQDLETNSAEDQTDYKILKLLKNKRLDRTHKDSKMVFDVFNRNIYNHNSAVTKGSAVVPTSSVKKIKSTWSKSRSKKKNPSLFVLSSYYNKQAPKCQVKPTSPTAGLATRLKSSSFSDNYYKTSMLTICKKKEEASSSRIFRMESFLNNIEKLTKSTASVVKAHPAQIEKERKQAKEKKFFPNQTLMATCNKLFDICKLDTSTGFFNFNKSGHNSEIRFFSKTKIRKKIRDNVFNFKSRGSKKIELPIPPPPLPPTQPKKTFSISSSQNFAELNMLSSNSEIYWNQKIHEIESTRNSLSSSSSLSTDDDEVVRINEENIKGTAACAEDMNCYRQDNKCKLSDDEVGAYNYNEYSMVDFCSNNLNGKISKKREDGLGVDQIKYLNIIVHRLPGEKLGMNLRVEESGHIVVINVVENGAANRASDLHGNSCPIMPNDCIVEINGVSLHV